MEKQIIVIGGLFLNSQICGFKIAVFSVPVLKCNRNLCFELFFKINLNHKGIPVTLPHIMNDFEYNEFVYKLRS